MLTLLKKIKTKVRLRKLPKAAKKVLSIVLSLLILDALVTVLGAPYLSANTGTFLGKSSTVILSDLLFLEGAVIFAIGTLIVVLRSMHEKLSYKPSTETTDNAGQTREKRLHPSILMMVIGAILMGLSVTIGTLLP